jgi:hypothetical protein
MKNYPVFRMSGLLCAALLALAPLSLFGQDATQINNQGSSQGSTASDISGPPARLVVTAEVKKDAQAPVINREDVMVYQGKEKRAVLNWTPTKGPNAGLELFLLIDDSLGTDVSSQFGDLRKFIQAQPTTTAIGIAYMQNGGAMVAQQPTTDRAQAIKSLRIPLGQPGINASPYLSLSDLVKRWQSGAPRREVIFISDGIDRLYGAGPSDPYVDTAISDAQKAGVIVYSIYSEGAGHFGHSFWRMNWGQNYESQLSDETGGESYYTGIGAPVAFAPYLDDISRKLNNQYLLTFSATPKNKPGLQAVRLHTEVPHTDLATADRVLVAGS